MDDLDQAPHVPAHRVLSRPIPAEGADGRFTQTWYPICLASEVPVGAVVGNEFLDGRVAVYRGEDGRAQVLSAYCSHLGADLAVGRVVGSSLECAYHRWCYSAAGRCVRTGTADPAPRGARVFSFPTVERHGLIWAFNGERPLFDVPGFEPADAELVTRAEVHPEVLPVDPWVICANTPDNQHHQAVHGFVFAGDPSASIEWGPHSMSYHLRARKEGLGLEIDVRMCLHGTNIFLQEGMMNGRWFGFMAPMGLPSPQRSRVYFVVVVRRSEGSDEENDAMAARVMEFEKQTLVEDLPIMRTIHFRPGTLSAADRGLARFFDYVRDYPRAHPAQAFLR